MRYLLLPKNNCLSHIAKCLAIRDCLHKLGHQAIIAVSKGKAFFPRSLRIEHRVLLDIQESDNSSYPTYRWFRDLKRIQDCIKAEIDLIREVVPHRVLGVFRFTGKISAMLCGVPFDSLICGCMLPECVEVMGFGGDEAGRERQRELLDNFFRYAGARLSRAASIFGYPQIQDVRTLLKGDRTFLWDFPAFMPLSLCGDVHYVGPIVWNHWPGSGDQQVSLEHMLYSHRSIALVSFGTSNRRREPVERIVRNLLDMGFFVVLAAGGDAALMEIDDSGTGRLGKYLFIPLESVLPQCTLAVCHGGQMTVFEALKHRIPVIVMPNHPEQAHNGVCLERLGLGRRLVPGQQFRGDSAVYFETLSKMSDREIQEKIYGLLHDPELPERLEKCAEMLGRHNGSQTVSEMLGG